MTWEDEFNAIVTAARLRNVDPAFVAAIRKTENGGPGKEFGVLTMDAPTYETQLSACCVTVAHRLRDFVGNPLEVRAFPDHIRIMYSEDFIRAFASKWAPVGVSNDPQGLNRNWLNNCLAFYDHFTKD